MVYLFCVLKIYMDVVGFDDRLILDCGVLGLKLVVIVVLGLILTLLPEFRAALLVLLFWGFSMCVIDVTV